MSPLAPAETERPWPLRPVSDARLAVLYQQLAAVLGAGVGVPAALALLLRHTRGRLHEALARVRAAAEGGATLTEALAADPVVFPASVRGLVQAGESSGGLAEILAELAAALELRLVTRRRLLRACVYPLLLFSLSFFILPLPALVTAGVGAYLRASLLRWVVALAGLAAALVLVPLGLRAWLGPLRAARLVRRLPLLGPLRVDQGRATFARHLSSALRAGLEVFTALRLAAQATGDPELTRRIELAAERVRAGATLEAGLAHSGLFDDGFLMAVAGGEASGRLEESLAQQARLLQDSLLHRMEVLLQVGAVAVLLAVYAFVGWSMYVEYKQLLGAGPQDIEDLMKQLEPGSVDPGRLPPELR